MPTHRVTARQVTLALLLVAMGRASSGAEIRVERQVRFRDAADAMTDPAIKLVFVAD